MNDDGTIRDAFSDAAAVLAAFMADAICLQAVAAFAEVACAALGRGGTLLACGNGGSMCDAMHFAEEWTGRFRRDRRALPALALSDPAVLTCIANDYGYDDVFARQVEAIGQEGDVLVAISTSGESPNVLRAIEAAKRRRLVTVGLLGRGGGLARSLVDVPIVVPRATMSDRIQEVHMKVLHIVIETVERRMFPANYGAL